MFNTLKTPFFSEVKECIMNCFRAVKIVSIARIQKVYRCYAIGIFLCSLVCHTHIALFLLIKLVVARTVRSINQLRQFYFCSVTTSACSKTLTWSSQKQMVITFILFCTKNVMST